MELTLQKLEIFKQTFLELKDSLKWKVSDQRILMMVSSIYTASNRNFQLSDYLNVCDYLKEYSGMFSPFKSYHRFLTGAMLDTRFEDPFAKFEEMKQVHDLLAENGFRKGMFTYISALAFISTGSDNPQKAAKAYELYSRMKEKHYFLTSASDYPLAVLLADREESPEAIIDTMESFYEHLSRSGFKKGNDLQFLSHILSLSGEKNPQNLVSRCLQTVQSLEQHGLSLKKIHYPEVGILSLVTQEPDYWSSLAKTVGHLNAEKSFKWHKNMNFTIAVHLMVSEQLQHSAILETGLYTSIEMMMQAQQAAVIAAIAGASASDGGGGGE